MTDGDVTRKIRVKQIDIVPTCSLCAKPISEQRKGSFTAWVFRADSCSCSGNNALNNSANSSSALKTIPSDFPDLGDRFKIEELIGRGGMADVFKALDSVSGSTVAIKVLRKDVASDKDRVEGFEREIRAAMVLDHPNLAAVFDFGTTGDGRPYSVMEYVDGRPLDEAPPGDGLFLDANKAIDIFLQICEGLAHAHARGIVHLDLKPSNILRSKRSDVDIAKILDFGIARILTGDTKQELSESDEVIGSLPYMSPEQLNGEDIDFRSDIYSLGCLMYEILTGRVPYDADNPVKIIMNHFDGLPHGFTTQFKRMEVPRGLEQVIRHCLERDPNSRYQCIEELIRDLEMVRDGGNPEVAQRQIQLEKQNLAILTPEKKRFAVAVGGVSLLAYMVYLSNFDTMTQIIQFSQAAYCCGLFAICAKVFFFARPYLIDINARLKTPARAWAGDRLLQTGLLMLMLSSTVVSSYSIALLLWYHGFKSALNWLIVPRETYSVLVVLPTISVAVIIFGLWRKSVSLTSGQVKQIRNQNQDKAFKIAQICYLAGPAAAAMSMQVLPEVGGLLFFLVLPVTSLIWLCTRAWRRSEILSQSVRRFIVILLFYVLVPVLSMLSSTKPFALLLDYRVIGTTVLLGVPVCFFMMVSIVVKQIRLTETKRIATDPTASEALNELPQGANDVVALPIESDVTQ